jgi:hypothetical protein
VNPDDVAAFRCARLLLMLDLVREESPEGIDAERLGVYDFFAAHPLLLTRDPDDPDRMTLLLAGFDERALAYASPAQRLATAQQNLARDLAVLIGTGLVEMRAAGRIRYRLTAEGQAAAQGLNAAYASSYTVAGGMVLRRLRRLSGRRLRSAVRRCTAALDTATSLTDPRGTI